MNKQRPLVTAISAAIGAIGASACLPTLAQEGQLEEILITGSKIQRANLESSSPITQLDSEQITLTGITRIEDAMASIPAISLDQSSGQAIESNGTATLQLRNLGTTRTLVLMNDRRLPAAFQGTPFSSTKPIRFLKRPATISASQDKAARDALRVLEQENQNAFPGDANLAARIASYELAARMQLTVPEAANLKAEPAHIRKLYGADSDDRHQAAFADNCILARRLIERGVRFVQLFNGAYASGGRINWDGREKNKMKKHASHVQKSAPL